MLQQNLLNGKDSCTLTAMIVQYLVAACPFMIVGYGITDLIFIEKIRQPQLPHFLFPLICLMPIPR